MGDAAADASAAEAASADANKMFTSAVVATAIHGIIVAENAATALAAKNAAREATMRAEEAKRRATEATAQAEEANRRAQALQAALEAALEKISLQRLMEMECRDQAADAAAQLATKLGERHQLCALAEKATAKRQRAVESAAEAAAAEAELQEMIAARRRRQQGAAT